MTPRENGIARNPAWRDAGALVVGLGSIGERHLGNLAALGIKPLGICRSGKGSRLAGDQPPHGAQVYESFENALSEGYDLVVVANPTHLHLEYALAAVEAGRHVYLEKPLAHKLEGIGQLVKAQHDSGSKIQMGCQLRFHPILLKIKKWIDQGLIGKPYMAFVQAGQYLPDWHPGEDYRQSYASRRDMGGGVVLTLIHEIDYLQWLLGPIEVNSALGGVSKTLELDAEDHVLALLRSQGDCIISLGLDYLQRPFSRGCKLVGAKGAIIADLAANWAELVVEGRSSERFVLPEDWDTNQPYLDCMQDLLDAITQNSHPSIPLYQGIDALRAALKIKEFLAMAT